MRSKEIRNASFAFVQPFLQAQNANNESDHLLQFTDEPQVLQYGTAANDLDSKEKCLKMGKAKAENKRLNPRENANILSIITFTYILPIFVKGYRKTIEEDDIPDHLNEHSSKLLGDQLENEWLKELTRQNPSLWRAIMRTFGCELIIHGILYTINQLLLKTSQPVALFQLMKYYSTTDNKVSESEAILYAGIIVGSSLLNIFVTHNNILALQHLGMKLRVACCSLIYRKSLRLNKSVLGGTTIGQTITLLSNDMTRCDRAALHAHTLWVCPVQIAFIIIILYNLLGLTSAVGVTIMVLLVPLQVYLAKKISEFRMRTAFKTDERIRLMNEIISGIQVIKTYTWEMPFTKLVDAIRRLEILNVRSNSFIKAIMMSIQLFITRLSIFLTILTYVLTGNSLQANYVFVVTSFCNIIRQIMTKNFSSGITELAELNVSISRLKTFLLYEEACNQRDSCFNYTNKIGKSEIENSNQTPKRNSENVVELKDISTKWILKALNNTLQNVNFQVKHGQCVALVGPVGSGKTTLLHVILKELPILTGTSYIKGTLSYATQEPWVFSGNIQENIIFGQTMDKKRYQRVLEACALEQDLTFLPYGDKTKVGERGTMLSGGQKARINLARAVYKKADIYIFDDPFSAVDPQVGKELFEKCILKFLKNKSIILVTHQLQYLQNVEYVYIFKNGKVTLSGTYEQIRNSQMSFVKQLDGNKNIEICENVEVQQSSPNYYDKLKNGNPTEVKEHRSFGTISKDIYLSYMKAGGSLCIAIFILFVFIMVQASSSTADYFLTFWVNLEEKDLNVNSTYTSKEGFLMLTRDLCIYIYSGIVVIMAVLTLIGAFGFYKYCMRASIRLHNSMLSNVIYAPMKFFNMNSSGRILNRFSKDIGLMDEVLPSLALDCLDVSLNVIGITVVVTIVKPWLFIASVVIFVIFYLFRVVYLATSRNVKRLDGITRSPVLEHVSMSLQGLTTIRAYGAQTILQNKFDDLQDVHSSVWFMHLACSKAFSFWLDMVCLSYLTMVTFSFFISKSEEYGGNVGLAITQAMNLTGRFQWGMRQWSDLENQMTSVERVVEYTKIEREEDPTEIIPPKSWPEEGNIKFQSVSLRYSSKEPYILKEVSLCINAKEKIGIVGRTGAGKSSLIYALFQLIKTEGEIIIDNINVSKIPLHKLRSKLSIIPQEPLLFYGTLRKNLDPFDEYSDDALWSALDEVQLKKAVGNLPSGLNSTLSERGSNFSVGQRQLLCLARALIRKNKILILDEATANVDHLTDKLIQDTIKKKFTDCTVLTIAHRLNTIMDSDKVLVMNFGNAEEYDHPYLLLKNKNSTFSTMVNQTGPVMAQSLLEGAKQHYETTFRRKED